MRMAKKTDDEIRQWFETIRKVHGPHIIGHESCTSKWDIFEADTDELPYYGAVTMCSHDCPK